MANLVSLYFQVHQPYRLRDIRFTDIGKKKTQYFDTERNRTIFRKVAEKCYLPTNALLLDLLKSCENFSVAFSLSGVFLDQCEEYGEDVLESFQRLAATGKVEFLAETYYHSLSALKSVEEFCDQVTLHVQRVKELFDQTPSIFRNTELIYSNDIAHIARLMGFNGILAEGVDRLLGGRSPNIPYFPPSFRLPPKTEKCIRTHRPLPLRSSTISLLLKNYRLSDDIAFRFSDRSWSGFPLYADTFAQWVAESPGHSVNLFMDYETFGEHQWKDTGIFEFLRALPQAFEKQGIQTITPSEVLQQWKGTSTIFDAHIPVSWADIERDLSAWTGNTMQSAALEALFALESPVKASEDPDLLTLWRRLQTSDHLYYMSTKHWNDGDVHKYFSPYDSPYEAYRRFSHALCDLRHRLTEKNGSLKFKV